MFWGVKFESTRIQEQRKLDLLASSLASSKDVMEEEATSTKVTFLPLQLHQQRTYMKKLHFRSSGYWIEFHVVETLRYVFCDGKKDVAL